jgi:hypothetical protein
MTDAERLAENARHLFVDGEFTGHSGKPLPFKIECDALTDADLDTLAAIVARQFPRFRSVYGVPHGGLRFAGALRRYATESPLDPALIVDDVLTTGGSMERARAGMGPDVFGIVVFARGPCPDWITPLFDCHRCMSNVGHSSYNFDRRAEALEAEVERLKDESALCLIGGPITGPQPSITTSPADHAERARVGPSDESLDWLRTYVRGYDESIEMEAYALVQAAYDLDILRAAAEHAGAEKMREQALEVLDNEGWLGRARDLIRALPLPGEE